MTISPDLPTIAVIPREVSTGMTVEIPFATAVSESESGVSGRKSTRDIPLRKYTLTINPDDAEEVMKIILSVRGSRWPVALRDWAFNYQLTDEPQTVIASTSPDVGLINLHRTFTPITGTRSLVQRILIIDESEVPFTVKLNGTPTSNFAIYEPGLMYIPGAVVGNTVTVSGQYLVPCCFVDDMLAMTVHVNNLCSIESVNLREIPETELVALIA